MLICTRKKINFITHFFLKILQRNSKLIFGNFGIPYPTTHNDCINLKKPLTFVCRQKSNFILHPCCFRYSGQAQLPTPTPTCTRCCPLVENFCVSLEANNQLHIFIFYILNTFTLLERNTG